MTAFYMFRLVFMTFFGECRADHHTVEHLHESSGFMTWPLIILAVGSVFAGFLGVPAALGGSNIFEHWLEPVFSHGAHGGGHEAHGHHDLTLEYGLMAASIGIACAGIFLAHLMYNKKSINPDGIAPGRGWPAAYSDLQQVLYRRDLSGRVGERFARPREDFVLVR